MKPSDKGKPAPPLALLAPTSYEVGYGKPPVHSRFRKGQSGNPKGRPKGAKTRSAPAFAERLKEIVLEEAYRTISVRDGPREVKVPMAQAVVRALAVNAVKGQQRAQRLFTELLAATEREKRRERLEVLESLFDYKLAWDRELARRARLGIVAPDPVPHPDQIRIDLRTGALEIHGPLTKEEQADLEVWRGHKLTLEDELARLEWLLEQGCEEMQPQEIEEEIRTHRQALEVLDHMLRVGRPLPLPEES